MSEKEVLEQFGFEPEEWEEAKDNFVETGFPIPVKRFRIESENFNMSIEEPYFWMLNYVRADVGYVNVKKTIDVFSAAENSAFFGVSQLRLGGQQEKKSQFLATIGKMTKELFQLVRELRIIDERLELYDNWESSKSADVTLKGLYIDLVEGATKNPSSVYGLAQNVGFTILPDLFFNTHVYDPKKVDEVIDGMDYNTQLKNVLRRKLYSYINWKIKTHKELKDRRGFQIKYLRQHWTTINMYMEWLKPYLRNIRRMQMSEKNIEDQTKVNVEAELSELKIAVSELTGRPIASVKSEDISVIMERISSVEDTLTTQAVDITGYKGFVAKLGALEQKLQGLVPTKPDKESEGNIDVAVEADDLGGIDDED